MDLGVCAAAKIDDIEYAVLAEALGYGHFWVADSQMIWSDCYATLALIAANTSRIRIGTGVAVAGTRPAAVQAAGIATINRLAPGRTFCGIGTGNTAMRIMGHKPIPLAEFDDYLVTLRALMDGEEAEVHWRGATAPTRHLMPDAGFVAFSPRIPMYVSAFGPKAMAIAARRGDGVVLGVPPEPAAIAAVHRRLREANPDLADREFASCLLTTMVVLQPGETSASRRVADEAGAMAIATLHYAYEQYRQYGRAPVGPAAELWPDYVAAVEEMPERRRHLRIHAGHNCWVIPEEERFVTPELLERTCMIGTAAQLAERLRALEEAGLQQVMLLPSLAHKERVLRDVAEHVLPLIRG